MMSQWIMRAHLEMCYMITKFTKRMLRTMRRPIRIKRLIHEFLYVENLVRRRKYPVNISAYVI
jgi:hypothetical protein